MVEKDFLNTQVGDAQRKLKVTDIEKKTVKLKDGGESEKIEFSTVEPETGKRFNISDSYVPETGNDNSKRISGLWYSENNGKINRSSALAKVLEFYDVDSLGDLMGKTVIAYPDNDNYLVLTACEM